MWGYRLFGQGGEFGKNLSDEETPLEMFDALSGRGLKVSRLFAGHFDVLYPLFPNFICSLLDF